MERKKTTVTILLNVLFCGVMLWLFARNSYLRPFSGSYFKEILACSLLLGSLYANYFLLYPKIHHNSPLIYWMAIVILAVGVGFIDLAISYNGIMSSLRDDAALNDSASLSITNLPLLSKTIFIS